MASASEQLLALCGSADRDALAVARDLAEEHGLCLPAMASLGSRGHASITARISDPQLEAFWHNSDFGDGDSYGSGSGDGGYVLGLGASDEKVYRCGPPYRQDQDALEDLGDGAGGGNTGSFNGDGQGFGE